jgi:hypothetical protein
MDEGNEAAADAFSSLTDEELEQELTIAASLPGREERYQELLAERERRREPRD